MLPPTLPLLGIDMGAPGIFNIVEPNDYVATEKAAAQLGWHARFRAVAVGRTGRTGECRQASPGQAVTAQQEGDGIFAPIGAGATRRQRDLLLKFDGIAH